MPYDKTFNWTDAFGVDTINAARVRETVTVQSATVYRWRFEVLNTSGNGGLPDDLYDLGIGRFSLYSSDTSAITPRTPPPGWTVAIYTNSDGSGTIVWQGGSDPIFVGESPVAFEFDTPPRALCDNGGYVFNANAEEQTAATGMVMMPGKDEATKKEGWTSWEEDTVAPAPGGEGRGKKFPATPSWTTAQAGERKTPGPPAANKDNIGEEGPYYKSKDKWGAFTLTIEFRFADELKRVRPGVPMPNPLKNQDFNNSGVYIHNRYEIQIVNPHRFDAAGGGAVAEGADVGDDPQDKLSGNVIVGNRNKLIPGGLYAVDSPNGEFKNRSKAAPAWNILVIEYCPPVLEDDPAQPGEKRIKTPAKLKTTLNGKEVWATADKEMAEIKDGTGPLKGTGGKKDAKPVDKGYIYLQSHWGNQVEFRNPVITGKLSN